MPIHAGALVRLLAGGALSASLTLAQPTEPAVALLSQKCLACHNDKKSSSGLSVETRTSALTGGNRGPAVVPGRPQDSLVMAAIRQTGALKMPPTGKLPDSEIDVVEKWIASGAPGLPEPHKSGPAHWAFEPPMRSSEPPVRQATRSTSSGEKTVRSASAP